MKLSRPSEAASEFDVTPLKLLSLLAPKLRKLGGQYAIAGGLAASFYRTRPRLTNDVDVALDTGGLEKTKRAAKALLKSQGLIASFGWIAGADKRLKSSIGLVIGHLKNDEYGSTIDILLPSLPWVPSALGRAEDNMIDFGFAKLSTLTPEDLIIAKAFALSLEPNRYQDLDDIQSILSAGRRLDRILLVEEFERLELSLPASFDRLLPAALKRVCKRNR